MYTYKDMGNYIICNTHNYKTFCYTRIKVIIFSIHKTPTLIIVSIPKYKYSYTCTYHVIRMNV